MHSPLAGPCGCCGSGSAEWITLLGMLRTGERRSGQERCGKQPCRERSAGSSRGQGCHGAVGEPDLGLPPACICPRAERAPKARGTHSRPGRAENGGREGLPRQWEGCARMAHAMGWARTDANSHPGSHRAWHPLTEGRCHHSELHHAPGRCCDGIPCPQAVPSSPPRPPALPNALCLAALSDAINMLP